MGFRYVEHTADAEFRAWATTLNDAFEQAALAMVSLVCDPATVRRDGEHVFTVEAENEEELLFAFLAEVLYIQDSKGIMVGAVDVQSMERLEGEPGGMRLRGSVRGEPYDSERHEQLGGVKAPTYHGLSVRHRQGTVDIRVIVDT